MGKHKSIVTKYENFSAFSGSPKQCEHHLLFGRGIRQLAWERKYLADKLASDENLGHQSSEDWMDEAREAFRNRYGESWL